MVDYYEGSVSSVPYSSKEIDATIDYAKDSNEYSSKTIERLKAIKVILI